MVDLTAVCPHMKDMMTFLRSEERAMAMIEKKSADFQWTPLAANVELLAPVTNPEKILCIGLNYAGHCEEQNKPPPTEPMFFSKFASTLTGPKGDVILHKITTVSNN